MISSLTPEIIYEDKDIIVCHKPAGVPTQSSRIGTKIWSVFLKSSNKNTAKKTASREPYLAVIHRLDQPVEGLLVLQKHLLPQRNFPASLPHLVLGNITVHRL